MSFNAEAMGTSCIFILMNPGLSDFMVEGNADVTAKGGSTPGAVFVMVLDVP